VSDIGYIELLRNNSPFRRLFAANMISFIGDWFTIISMFLIAGEVSDDSPLAIAGVLAVRSLTHAPLEPLTGMLADRYSRRGLMVLANGGSFVILVCFLSLDLLGNLLSVYALTSALVLARVLFDPAEYAYLPNICDEDELLTANAMGSAGWSVSLGIGAGLGGLTISELGVYQALWVDTLTFLVSALIFASLPPGGPEKEEGRESGFVTALSEIKNGWIHIIENSPIRRVVVAKAMWAAGGGAQVFLLILIGMEAGFGSVAAGSIGVLYMARGFGSGAGPVLGRRLMRSESIRPSLLGLSILTAGLFYLIISFVEWTAIILLLVFISHGSSGINWVMSTTLLQERTDDEWRGRVAGTDYLLLTGIMGLSALGAGLVLEEGIFSLRETIALTAMIQIVMGGIWVLFVTPSERSMI
tara:strand:+ start:61269 stop:62513 length:1245 start_codon:yes stop_codon:yes gene_type:complete